jgi:hypothetical protein
LIHFPLRRVKSQKEHPPNSTTKSTNLPSICPTSLRKSTAVHQWFQTELDSAQIPPPHFSLGCDGMLLAYANYPVMHTKPL